jgi:hypothetical protein
MAGARQILASSAIAQTEAEYLATEGERADNAKEKARCGKDILYWFDHWAWTYDPRLVGRIDPQTKRTREPYVRFKLWKRQREMALFVLARIMAGEPFIIEKSRDQGASYVMIGVALWCWLFIPGFKATFASRDADEVDTLNDPDSLFEKLRIMVDRLPGWMMPAGYDRRKHAITNLLSNIETGATITGEAGDNMGRGGRCTLFVVDEAAFVPRAAKVEAALSGNTDCVAWVSTVNPQEGMGNFFARKRHAFPERLVFRLHWRDDPRKTDEWAQLKKSSLTDEATWEAEYEINYTANTSGVCIPALWIRSAQLIGELLPHVTRMGVGRSGGDVGGGKAKSVLVHRFGPIVLKPQSRTQPDTTDTAIWMMQQCREAGTGILNFDPLGIGAGVLSTLMKADESDDKEIAAIAMKLRRIPISAGDPARDWIMWEDGRSSDDMFANLKMELWWLARNTLQRTHWHYLHLTGQEGGRKQLESEIVILPNSQDVETSSMISQLSIPMYDRTDKGKLRLESKEKLSKRGVPSPDYADAYVLTEFIPEDDTPTIVLDMETLRRETWRVPGIMEQAGFG